MKLTKSNIILIVCAVITFGGAFYYFVFFNVDSGAALVEGVEISEASQTETEFVELVSQLGAITFDISIFSDPRFSGLTDIRTPISPEEAGRRDPFGLIPGVVAP